MKEDAESWRDFLRHLKERGLKGVRLFISDKSLGLLESLPDFFADAQWQRCMVHWYRNVLKLVPRGKAKDVAAMLKAIHAQENHEEATKKATHVAEKASRDASRQLGLDAGRRPVASHRLKRLVRPSLSRHGPPRQTRPRAGSGEAYRNIVDHREFPSRVNFAACPLARIFHRFVEAR